MPRREDRRKEKGSCPDDASKVDCKSWYCPAYFDEAVGKSHA